MHRFSEEEAHEILRRATHAPMEGEYSQDDLRRSAEELGISPEALARAETEVREERVRKEFDLYQRARIRSEVVQTVTLIGGLAAINLLTSAHYLWFLWVAPWPILSLIGTIQKASDRNGPSYRRAFERWERKNGRVREGELAEIGTR